MNFDLQLAAHDSKQDSEMDWGASGRQKQRVLDHTITPVHKNGAACMLQFHPNATKDQSTFDQINAGIIGNGDIIQMSIGALNNKRKVLGQIDQFGIRCQSIQTIEEQNKLSRLQLINDNRKFDNQEKGRIDMFQRLDSNLQIVREKTKMDGVKRSHFRKQDFPNQSIIDQTDKPKRTLLRSSSSMEIEYDDSKINSFSEEPISGGKRVQAVKGFQHKKNGEDEQKQESANVALENLETVVNGCRMMEASGVVNQSGVGVVDEPGGNLRVGDDGRKKLREDKEMFSEMQHEKDPAAVEAQVRQLLTDLQLKRESERMEKAEASAQEKWVGEARAAARDAELAEGGARAAQEAARQLAARAEQATQRDAAHQHHLQAKTQELQTLLAEVRELRAVKRSCMQEKAQALAQQAAEQGARRGAQAALLRVQEALPILQEAQRKLESSQRRLGEQMIEAVTLRDQVHERMARAHLRQLAFRERLVDATTHAATLAAELGKARARLAE